LQQGAAGRERNERERGAEVQGRKLWKIQDGKAEDEVRWKRDDRFQITHLYLKLIEELVIHTYRYTARV
jgi:hypothetical protein